MSLEYDEMTPQQRMLFWSDGAIGRFVTTGVRLKLHEFIRNAVEHAYLQGVRDGAATERGDVPAYDIPSEEVADE